ncbi:MAG: pyridoxamine 5'-phosphate oxidase family protein [Candidatus Limnocylindrales bacterium]
MSTPIAPLTPAVRRFLDEAIRFATIATLGPDGRAHQAVIWYAVEDDGILINSRVGRRWPTELLRDPRIALTVTDPAIPPERTITIQGDAVVAATGAAALADILALARRYGSAARDFETHERISFRVVPRSVSVHGDLG